MVRRLTEFLRRIGLLHDFSPESLHEAELENVRHEQRKIMEAIGEMTESRRAGFARLRASIETATQRQLADIIDFDNTNRAQDHAHRHHN